jgi:cytochrome c biogenesis protein
MFKGYAFLILSSVFFIGVVIAGLFHLKQVGIYYFALLFVSGFLFAVSFLKFLWDSLRALYRDYKKFNSLPVFLFEFFASLKLAIFLMIAIGVLSMLGSTYIEQNRPFEFYVNKYGPEKAGWFWKLWLNDVFHSWYYILFVALLALNLILLLLQKTAQRVEAYLFKGEISKTGRALRKTPKTHRGQDKPGQGKGHKISPVKGL